MVLYRLVESTPFIRPYKSKGHGWFRALWFLRLLSLYSVLIAILLWSDLGPGLVRIRSQIL
jgi:hypothetical protein